MPNDGNHWSTYLLRAVSSTANKHWGMTEARARHGKCAAPVCRAGWGLGRHAIAPPQHGDLGALPPEKFCIVTCKSVHFLCIFASTITPNYTHSWHAIYNNENNYDRLCGGYKILHPRLTKYCVPGGRVDTKGNKYKLLNKSFHDDIWKYSFTAGTINTWNCLLNKIVDAESVNTFRTRLDRYWSDQPLLYDYKAELAVTGDRSKCDIEF